MYEHMYTSMFTFNMVLSICAWGVAGLSAAGNTHKGRMQG